MISVKPGGADGNFCTPVKHAVGRLAGVRIHYRGDGYDAVEERAGLTRRVLCSTHPLECADAATPRTTCPCPGLAYRKMCLGSRRVCHHVEGDVYFLRSLDSERVAITTCIQSPLRSFPRTSHRSPFFIKKAHILHSPKY